MSEFRPAKVTSPLGPDVLQLRRMTGREELGRAYFYELEFVSEDDQVGLNKVLGKPMTVHLETAEGQLRHFGGLCSRFSHAGSAGRYTLYRATVRPWLWFLTRTANCRIFQKMTVPDIIKQVFRDHGFSDLKDTLTGSYREWDYLVQYRETDFNFVTRLMEQEGIYFYFKHTEGAHTLVLSDGYSSHEPFTGYEEIPWFPPNHRARRERDYIDTIDVGHHVQPGAFVLDAFDFERPKAELMTKLAAPKEHDQAELEIYDYPGEYIQSSDGENYVRARLEGLHAMYEQIKGTGNARGLGVGSLFSLTGYSREDQNREYLVTSAEYTVINPDYEASGKSDSPIYRCSFTAIDSQIPYRTPATTPKPHVKGPQTAIVVGPKGEEIWTDKYGRVKVQFHWDRKGKKDENSSCWVRVAQVWAGTKWGAMHIPRIGQEVIVEHLEGDPDQPIITGRVYNADNMPPYDLPGNASQSGIKSRSTKGGSPDNFNEIRFEDKKGSELMYVHAEKDRAIVVEHDETTLVGHNRTEEVGNNEQITIKGNRTEEVVKNETITILGHRKEAVSGTEFITVTLARTEAVGGAETVAVAGLRTVTVGAADSLVVAGARNVAVGAVDIHKVLGNRSAQVGGNESASVGGGRSSQVGKDDVTKVNGSRSASVGKDETLKVAKKILVEAGDEIVIRTGDASITLKKDGKIQIKGKDILIDGKDITIKGSGKINIKASSDMALKATKINGN